MKLAKSLKDDFHWAIVDKKKEVMGTMINIRGIFTILLENHMVASTIVMNGFHGGAFEFTWTSFPYRLIGGDIYEIKTPHPSN